MTDQSSASTRVTAIIPAARLDVYHAFLDPAVMAAWLPPAGMRGEVHAFEPRVGGAFSMSLVYLDAGDNSPGKSSDDTDTFRGRFAELVPNERIVWTVEFESPDAAYSGEMTITWTFADGSDGTQVTVVCENIPAGISPADNEAGSRLSLANLAAHFSRCD